MIVPYSHVLILSAIIFLMGLICLLTRRNLIMTLIGVEIMMNSAAILFVAASLRWQQLEGQTFVLFIIAVAATEVSVGLALIVGAYFRRGSVDPDNYNYLKW
ncbi:MAG: NADH-quinone oxidoreductase subunit NuoK [Thermodesulfobacteriota bacterium]